MERVMNDLPEGLEIEEGVYGPRLVLLSEWAPRYAEYMRHNDILELEVNYAKGFRGADLAFLSQIPFLVGLAVVAYHLRDLAPVHDLHQLKSLKIAARGDTSRIDFGQFPVLEDCTLEWRPKAESVFECTTLRRLWINKYRSKSADSFSSLTSLEELFIATSPVEDIRGLASLSRLRLLGLYNLQYLQSLEGLEHLTALEELRLKVCRKVGRLDELRFLSNLTRLTLGNCGKVATLQPLRGLPRLEWMWFYESTDIVDGDLLPLLTLPRLSYVSFPNRRHYSHRCEDFPQCHH